MTVYQIVYQSKAHSPMSEQELQELLQEARAFNHENRLTGILLYGNGNFLQVLEGEQQTVDTLYHKIAHDPRHTDVLTLTQGDVPQRAFPDWSMGFSSLSNQQLAQLIGYINPDSNRFLLARAHNTDPALLALIKEFVRQPKATS